MARIEIYARLRPTRRRFEGLSTSSNNVSVQIGQRRDGEVEQRFSKAPGTHHDFTFCRAFDDGATQSEIFETVARKIVDRFVDGYNGTVFAYGQTSTGKTYTMEGNMGREEDRGLIPRTLSYLYSLIEEKEKAMMSQTVSQADSQRFSSPHQHEDQAERKSTIVHERERAGVKVQISHMEIYQDTGFDLLNPGARPGSLMLTLPKVQISEALDGRVIVRDLSLHDAPNELVALDLLMKGSACRKVAETVMNQSSSRSHSIFTITMTTKQPGSEVVLRSKLHLVDLAGSERVSKTGSDGRILQEAKQINLSLHHLEHVIISLQQRSRSADVRRCGHIPYRNSMLTMVLRDSLGGNCLTAMIATVSAEEDNILETISTLRFSQRVACISNRASRNEELDDKAVIKKLKRRVIELERELISIRENKILPPQMKLVESGGGLVAESQRQLCHHVLYDFFHGRITNPVEAGINTPALFQECLHVLRGIVIDAVKSRMSDSKPASSLTPSATNHHHQIRKQTHHQSSEVWRNQRDCSGGGEKGVNLTTTPTTPAVGREEEGLKSRRKRNRRRRSRGNNRQSPCQSHDNHKEPPLERNPRPRREFLRTPPLEPSSPDNRSPTRSHSLSPSHPHDSSSFSALTPSTPRNSSSRLSSGIGSLPEEEVRHTPPSSSRKPDPPHTWAKRVMHPHMIPPAKASKSPVTMGNPSSLASNGEPFGTTFFGASQENPRSLSTNASVFTPYPPISSPHPPIIVPRSTSSLTARPPPISPEAKMQQQQQLLQERVHGLQRSREKKEQVSSDIQILSLRVQEEELRTKLENVAEKVAGQHARILAHQHRERRGGAAEGSSVDFELGTETLVEQQLRIKQARLNQKLQSVQQQIRSLRLSPQIPKSKPLPISPSFSTSQEVKSPPKASHVAAMVNEVTHNETKVVMSELDQLRETQLEKELELKEVATRRKMEELKRQLLSSTNNPPPPPTFLSSSPTIISQPSSAPVPSHRLTSPNSHGTSLSPQATQKSPETPPYQDPKDWRVARRSGDGGRERGGVVREVARQQKDRVSRIRRCVSAAATIQRAWRRHTAARSVT